MKILLDNCVPKGLKKKIREHGRHDVVTAPAAGLDTVSNGALLDATEADGYDILITADKKMKGQQDLGNRRFGTIVLPTNHWNRLKKITARINDAVPKAGPGEVIQIEETKDEEGHRSMKLDPGRDPDGPNFAPPDPDAIRRSPKPSAGGRGDSGAAGGGNRAGDDERPTR